MPVTATAPGTTDGAAVPSRTAPIFVFGVDHSGTTVLYRMLAYHPELAWFSQFTLRDGSIPGRSRRPGAGILEPRLRFVAHSWDKGDPALRRWLGPRPGEEGQIWDYLLGPGSEAPGRIRECLAEFSARHGGRRVLAKRPAFGRNLGTLRAAFPAASFVHVVRDGRPVALSLRAKMAAAGETGDDADPGAKLREAAATWVGALETVSAAAPDLHLLEVRYEDFCADVHGVLSSILEHAGLARQSFPWSRCPGQLDRRNSRWLEAASATELGAVEAVEGPMLRRYGYQAEA